MPEFDELSSNYLKNKAPEKPKSRQEILRQLEIQINTLGVNRLQKGEELIDNDYRVLLEGIQNAKANPVVTDEEVSRLKDRVTAYYEVHVRKNK